MANFSKASRFEGKVVLSRTSLIGTLTDNYLENSRSKTTGFISPMKASRTRAGIEQQEKELISQDELAWAERARQRLAQVRKAEIDQMKMKHLEVREVVDKEAEEENRRKEEKKKQIWAEIHEKKAQDKAKLEAEVREKVARQEAYRIAMEQREAEALEKRQREAARIKKIIQKREADQQARMKLYQAMAREELAREEAARKAGTQIHVNV